MKDDDIKLYSLVLLLEYEIALFPFLDRSLKTVEWRVDEGQELFT
jgi:hypothetical protein